MAFFKTATDLYDFENAIFLMRAFYALNSFDYKESLTVVINHDKMHFCYILYVKIKLIFSLRRLYLVLP